MMNKIKLTILIISLLMVLGCKSGGEKETPPNLPISESSGLFSAPSGPDPTVFSFAFVGCNRLNAGEKIPNKAPSRANSPVLKRILDEIADLNPKPDYFFFLGDMILAEWETQDLLSQLSSWTSDIQNPSYSKFAQSGIKMVAIPGNHELLTSKPKDDFRHRKNQSPPIYDEVPLKGATEIWAQYILSNPQFTPAVRDTIAGPNWKNNSATYGFKVDLPGSHKKVAFILINTDTYNEEGKYAQYGYGEEGQIPLDSILALAKRYKNDSSIAHVFAMSHKPCIHGSYFDTSHIGIPKSKELFTQLDSLGVLALLSAHLHYYTRCHPAKYQMQQIVAGNGGSSESGGSSPPPFFGYSIIEIHASGNVTFRSEGFKGGSNYYDQPPSGATWTRDSCLLFPSSIGNGACTTGFNSAK